MTKNEVTAVVDPVRGFNVPPIIVGIVRGAIEAAALAGLAFIRIHIDEVIGAIPNPGIAELAGLSGVALWGIRTLESYADQLIDPHQNRNADKRAATP